MNNDTRGLESGWVRLRRTAKLKSQAERNQATVFEPCALQIKTWRKKKNQVVRRMLCKWLGHANNVQRVEFNSTVAERVRELGWQVEREIKLTKILGRSLDRDYGDVDVLLWCPNSGRVLVMECKDLQFHESIGEVAEQLSDFRGEIGPDGKPDHLKRHLDRVEPISCEHTGSLKSITDHLGHPVERAFGVQESRTNTVCVGPYGEQDTALFV